VKRACVTRRLDSQRRPHPGLTMVELLIVVAVMVILMGMALPMMRTGIEGRRLREAARQVNTGVTLAKALAAETGRPAGLVIDTEALPEDPKKRFARRLYLAETPPPYAGDVVGAAASILSGGGVLQARFNDDGFSSNLPNVVKVGDFVRFDYRNPVYVVTAITEDTSTPPNTRYILNLSGKPWPTNGALVPYQFTRLPEKSSSTPMELPVGTVIDMNYSGFGLAGPVWTPGTPCPVCYYCRPTSPNGYWYVVTTPGTTGAAEPTWTAVVGDTVTDGTSNPVTWRCVGPGPVVDYNSVTPAVDPYPVTLVFGASGRMATLMGLNGNVASAPTQTLHLLIGNLENLGDLNLADPATLWVSIGHLNGRVTTAESGVSASAQTIQAAREFAQLAQGKGGL